MTTRTVLEALRRRWPLALLGLLLTVTGVMLVHGSAGTYHGQLSVRFLAPVSAANPNVIQLSSEALVQTAGIVKAEVNGGSYATGEALALTVRGGGTAESVSLPDSGTQFVAIFDEPRLVVEVKGDDPDAVRTRLDKIADRVEAVAVSIQERDRIAVENRIGTRREPEEGEVRHLPGQRARAMLAVVLLGLALTTWLTNELDTALVRRGRVRRTSGA